MDKKGRRRGAAAHLIEPVMNLKERYAVGGEFSGPARIEKTIELLAEAIRLDLLCGREPTVADITAKGIRCGKTVSRHFDAAYSLAKSRIPSTKANAGKPVELRALFRSNPGFPADILVPSQAEQPIFASNPDLPEASAPASTAKPIIDYADDEIAETMRSLAAAAWKRFTETGNWPERRRLRPSELRSATAARQPGSLFAGFKASGIKRVYRSIKDPVIRSAVA
jgi:hypothetical protein